MDLWDQFVSSPEARAAAIGAVLPFIMEFIKPYLPTGINTTPEGQPVENRYVPLATVIVATVLAVIGAVIEITTPGWVGAVAPYMLKSLVLGAGAGLAATGFVRGVRLAARGDKPARAAATFANTLADHGIPIPPIPPARP